MVEDSDGGVDGEVIPDNAPLPPKETENWLALVSNYTERPDLFLSEVEKHDPGFIARMNRSAEDRADETERARFSFSKFQAYTSTVVSVLAAMAVLSGLLIYIWRGDLSFWPIVGIGIVYAITQGGSLGFDKLISTLASLWNRTPTG